GGSGGSRIPGGGPRPAWGNKGVPRQGGPPRAGLQSADGQGRNRLGDAGRGDREGVGDQDGPAQPADREGGLPGRGGGPPHRRGVSVRVGWERETAEGRGAGGPERRG